MEPTACSSGPCGKFMAIIRKHDIHERRRGRNLWIGMILGGFVLVVFLITIVKLQDGQSLEAFDHMLRTSLVEDEQ